MTSGGCRSHKALARSDDAPATTSCRRTSTTWRTVLDLDLIRGAGVRIGADPLGGASVDYWGAIAERYGLDLTVVNPGWTRAGRS